MSGHPFVLRRSLRRLDHGGRKVLVKQIHDELLECFKRAVAPPGFAPGNSDFLLALCDVGFRFKPDRELRTEALGGLQLAHFRPALPHQFFGALVVAASEYLRVRVSPRLVVPTRFGIRLGKANNNQPGVTRVLLTHF